MQDLARVYVLYTGGTIGMGPETDDPNSPLVPKPLKEFVRLLPHKSPKQVTASKISDRNLRQGSIGGDTYRLELDGGNAIELRFESFEIPVDSSDISPKDWREMALKISTVYDEYDGFVILHGTDTMAFTASGLSFMLENLGKPVVLTGSQLPMAEIRTDAVLNFINAVYIAGYKATDLPLIPEVIIVFADKIIRGCRATKASSTDWAGFVSPNFPLLGRIGEHIKVNTKFLLPKPPESRRFFVNMDLDENVFSINIFPGFKKEQYEKIFLDENVKGILLSTYGAGNVPQDEDFLNAIETAVKSGKVVVNLSQCQVGSVEMGLYEASNFLLERGVLSGLDMTLEAALAKLMWILATQYDSGKYIQMQISQRGEQTEDLFDLRFGQVPHDKPISRHTVSVTPDGRLDRDRISRVVLRFSGLKVHNSKDDLVALKVFMNMPSANRDTNENERRCLGLITFRDDGSLRTRIKNVTTISNDVIGKGDVILTIVTDQEDRKVSFDGLFLTIYVES